MRRLITHLESSVRAHRQAGERGAVAVLTALSMVVLLGFVALAVDVGLLYAERAELQSGADAAALAIGQDCALGRAVCAAPTVTAQALANANAKDGAAAVVEATVNKVDQSVGVRLATGDAHGVAPLPLAFARVLGHDSATVGAFSKVRWGNPKSGPAVLPVALSRCQFHLNGGLQVLRLHGSNGHENCNIKSPTSGANLPGGFGLVTSPSGSCSVEVTTDQRLNSYTGNSIPNVCKDALEKLKPPNGNVVLLPLYDDLGSQGSSGWYSLEGWAAFRIVGWRFPGSDMAFNNTTADRIKNNEPTAATCTSPCTGLIGEFVRFSTLTDDFELGGSSLGAAIVELTE